MGFFPITADQLFTIGSIEYKDQADLAAGLDKASSVGALLSSASKIGETLDNQAETVYAVSRSTTSFGPDKDSFWTPFVGPRVGPKPSSGVVTLFLDSPVSSQQSIAPGYVVATQTGVQFIVVSSSLTTFNGSSYVVSPGSSQVDAAVTCATPGTIGNVGAGSINSKFSGPGSQSTVPIARVTNALPFINGADGELDADYEARAQQLVKSGRVATNSALLASIAGVQTGLTYQIGDAINADGTAHAAHFTAVVDVLGTSSGPSAGLLAAVAAAIDGGSYNGVTYPAIRAAGITRDIVGPTEVLINTAGVLKIAPGFVPANVANAATAAMAAYLNYFGLSVTNAATLVPYAEVIAVLLGVPGVAYPSNVTIARGAGTPGVLDISVPFANRPVAGSITFTTV